MVVRRCLLFLEQETEYEVGLGLEGSEMSIGQMGGVWVRLVSSGLARYGVVGSSRAWSGMVWSGVV